MRSTTTLSALIALAGLAPSVLAHWNLAALVVNGEETEDYKYVRRTKNSNSPVTDVSSDDFICNVGGIDDDVLSETETYTVAPGDELGFTVATNWGHPGVQQVYMSKAPNTAKTYKGAGEWFKIYSLTTSSVSSDGVEWAPFVGGGITNFTFTLPEDTPAGEYLLRGEGLALHGASEFQGAQWYIGCAQIKVTGSGAGSPGPTVQFPGAYTGREPGVMLNMYWPPLTNYTAPGPAVWPGKCEDHTANFVGQDSDGDCTPLAGGSNSTASK
ncbi:lytic polysaccharide monooxygenase auxiliary activity family 9 protein [Aspergillus undulatus]|uniref:lytic polysaccharide monooxygenase auxiliary activity family 9 protein n=1 Tax=Aspergillus undulatus TaxID=1810928 RepID=UPI003CCD5C51